MSVSCCRVYTGALVTHFVLNVLSVARSHSLGDRSAMIALLGRSRLEMLQQIVLSVIKVHIKTVMAPLIAR